MSMLVAPFITTFADALGLITGDASVIIGDEANGDFSNFAPHRYMPSTSFPVNVVLPDWSARRHAARILLGDEVVVDDVQTKYQSSEIGNIPHLVKSLADVITPLIRSIVTGLGLVWLENVPICTRDFPRPPALMKKLTEYSLEPIGSIG